MKTVYAALLVILGTHAAYADVVISSRATENMSCSAGLCVPTAENAVLNVSDLESLLASGNLEILTHGHRVEARNILIKAAVSSLSSNTLVLLASSTISVRSPVSVSESGNLELSGKTISIDGSVSVSETSTLSLNAQSTQVEKPISVQDTGGISVSANLLFVSKGRITFANLSSNLSIDGKQYTLENSLPSLAAAIAANPAGDFALANSYDASGDGTYTASPIPTNFLGSLEGLGNAISNISVDNTTACCVGGLFQSISEAQVSDVRLANVNINSNEGAAGLAYESFGTISGSSVTGSVVGAGSGNVAGLVADNYGYIQYSSSTASVLSGATANTVDVGGLVAAEYGSTSDSFASGAVSADNGPGNIGGLIGEQVNPNTNSQLTDCYATGNVSGGPGSNVGGLIGSDDFGDGGGQKYECYSSGAVSAGNGSSIGGLIGVNDNTVSNQYWDTTSSGTDDGVGLGNATGIIGLTTAQFQSGLPSGFDRTVWAESPKINGGLPYLRDNPPKK